MKCIDDRLRRDLSLLLLLLTLAGCWPRTGGPTVGAENKGSVTLTSAAPNVDLWYIATARAEDSFPNAGSGKVDLDLPITMPTADAGYVDFSWRLEVTANGALDGGPTESYGRQFLGYGPPLGRGWARPGASLGAFTGCAGQTGCSDLIRIALCLHSDAGSVSELSLSWRTWVGYEYPKCQGGYVRCGMDGDPDSLKEKTTVEIVLLDAGVGTPPRGCE